MEVLIDSRLDSLQKDSHNSMELIMKKLSLLSSTSGHKSRFFTSSVRCQEHFFQWRLSGRSLQITINRVCWLKRSLNKFKQLPRAWFDWFTRVINGIIIYNIKWISSSLLNIQLKRELMSLFCIWMTFF